MMKEEIYDEVFKKHLPNTLFMSHYELADHFTGSSANEWRQYLKDNEHFITSETAAIAEANARSALSKLGSGASSQEVSAIKALLEKSKLINDAQKQQQHVLVTYMPSKGQEDATKRIRSLENLVEFLDDYSNYITYLADIGKFDKTQHTREWFRKYKEEKSI